MEDIVYKCCSLVKVHPFLIRLPCCFASAKHPLSLGPPCSLYNIHFLCLSYGIVSQGTLFAIDTSSFPFLLPSYHTIGSTDCFKTYLEKQVHPVATNFTQSCPSPGASEYVICSHLCSLSSEQKPELSV